VAEEAQVVKWTYAARADFLEALEYIIEESPAAAGSFLQEVEAAAASLIHSPHRGAAVRELEIPALRQIVVGRYRLVYQVEEGGVAIVRLIHGSRDFRAAWRNAPSSAKE
jgi:plasmid stabilization system protein ParE